MIFAQDIETVRQPAHEHWTHSNGYRLFMSEKKSLRRPCLGTVLLVHGSSMGSQGFDLDIKGDPDASIMDYLACRGFDVWRFDCIGYGRSDKPDDHLATVAQAVPDILAVSDYIRSTGNSDGLMLLGYSSGALRAAMFAEKHPERVKRLALEAFVYTGAGSPTLRKRAEKMGEWKSSVRRPLSRDFLMSTMTRDHSETTMESRKLPFIESILALEDSVPNGTYIDMCENLPLVNPRAITVATAILRGEFDGIASDEDVLEFFRLLPNPDKEFVFLPGVAHTAGTAKNYLRFYSAVLSFFARPEPVFVGTH
jgi:pimeloyl-ACP methyl ester carboxylesterase